MPERTSTTRPRHDTRSLASCFILFFFLSAGMPSIDSAMSAGTTSQMTGSLPIQGSQPAPLVELSVITPVERELKGGAAESFLVHLKAGEFVEISVDQEGIDVVASLFGPD